MLSFEKTGSRLESIAKITRRDVVVALSSLVIAAGGVQVLSQEPNRESLNDTAGLQPPEATPKKVEREPKPPRKSTPSNGSEKLVQQRFGAYTEYTEPAFLTILEGTVHIEKGAIVHAAPSDAKFAAASRETTRLAEPTKIKNPVKIAGPDQKEWLLIESNRGAGYVNLSRGPLDTFDELPRTLTIEKQDHKQELKTTSDVQANTARVLKTDNHIYNAGGQDLEFNIEGYTFDPATTKNQLVKEAKQAELLPLSKPVK